jgi:DNA-3-methyladenine glycosylase I
MHRCSWADGNPLMEEYHDTEWGVPVHEDLLHFEFLTLDAFQAGLSWAIILRKRDGFRAAFDGFDPERVARYGRRQVSRLLRDPGIVRNRQKIEATISNARAFLEVQEEFGGFDSLVWRFVGGAPRVNRRRSLRQIPARTAQSDAMSRELMRRGFRFVGSTICYAYMQAAGMVNDHLVSCFRYRELGGKP